MRRGYDFEGEIVPGTRLRGAPPEAEVAGRTGRPGVAVGLCRTAAGGEVLFVEVSRMPGTGELTLTGRLGSNAVGGSQAPAPLRTLTEITLPHPRRAKQRKRGCALMKLANLYRSLSLALVVAIELDLDAGRVLDHVVAHR